MFSVVFFPGTYEVINAGTSGYGTDQELVFFQSKGKRLYFVKDGHWNPLRHKLAGKILAKHVLSINKGKVWERHPWFCGAETVWQHLRLALAR